jgi:diaminopimelate epimerase
MFNPDGSEFERSGNGLRILCAYLHSVGRVRPGVPFQVEVGGERVTMEVLGRGEGGVLDVSVDMGRVNFGPIAAGADPSSFLSDRRDLGGGLGGSGLVLPGPEGANLKVHPVSVGNPHCVVFRPGLLVSDLLELGPYLAGHPAFPNGTNVQVGRVVSPGELEILIWERGVGRTSSSGTSACAAAAAGVRAGLLSPGAVEVVMEGGSFTVTVSPEMSVTLRGPVQPIFVGELAGDFLSGFRS